ncbi:MAG TPA: IclR family transcriptional regulator [Bacilli bacterium]
MEDQKLKVRAVERALDILMCFTEAQDLGLSEIAGRVNLHKSTVHRLLTTLEDKGFIIRNSDTDKYRLGFRIWELSANLSQSDDPAFILLPEMEKLRDILGETVSLYIRDGIERIRIQAVQSNQAIRRVAPVGVRLPLYAGASSKVLFAFADDEEQRWMRNESPLPKSIKLKLFDKQLNEIVKLGYATSIEEREPGAAAVAAPILNRANKLVAALSVSGPSNRLTLEKMKGHSQLIIDTAKRMGKMLK